MATDDNDDNPDLKVKQLVEQRQGATTEADLARWFGLPSFQQLAEQPKPQQVVDEEMQAAIERRQRALAHVDPAFVDALYVRTEQTPATLMKFEAKIDVRIDDQFGTLDAQLLERLGSIAEPREVEISDELRDDMRECTPQALLRDLHRAELDFDKQFEIVDVAAGQRFDIVAEVASAMATRWKLPELDASPLVESRDVLEAARAERRRPWTDYLPALRNRRVRE